MAANLKMTVIMTMTVNEQILKGASDVLLKYDNWIIFTHRRPDGDAVGSVTALITAGLKNHKQIKWFGVECELPTRYDFLPNINYYEACSNDSVFNDSDVLYIFLDCANETRSIKNFPAGYHSINIDHHEDNNLYAEYNCVDGQSSSTCEMLLRIFKAGNWNLDKQIAECLFTGIYTDTGGFAFTSTSALTHNLVADLINLGVDSGHMTDLINQNWTESGALLWSRAFNHIKILGGVFLVAYLQLQDYKDTHASSADNEGLPNILMSIRDIKFVALISESFSGEIRASFRSREGIDFGAGEIARMFGGGGHERAAGATLKGSLFECVEQVENLLLSKLKN